MTKIKIGKEDIHVGIFVVIIGLLFAYVHFHTTEEATEEEQITEVGSNTAPIPRYLSVKLTQKNWGAWRRSTKVGNNSYQISGTTIQLDTINVWKDMDSRVYEYVLFFLSGEENVVTKVLPVVSSRKITEDEIEEVTDDYVMASGNKYYKSFLSNGEAPADEYRVTDNCIVDTVYYPHTSRTYWWWIALIFAFALCIGAIFLIIGGITDGEVSMIITGIVIGILAGYWISYLFRPVIESVN